MRILFAYNRPRGEVWDAVSRGLVPDELMYGLAHFRKAGFDAEFTDEVFKRTPLTAVSRLVERFMSRGGRFVGFGLDRAVGLARLAENYELVVAVGDSTALPLLMLKRLGRFDTPVVYSSVGLAWLLEHRRWLDAFYRAVVAEAALVVHYGWAEGGILKRRLRLTDDEVRFVPFCVDTEFFADLASRGISSDGAVLALGRDPTRDWKILFEAVRVAGVRLRLVCPRSAIAGLAVPDEVEWMDEVPFWRLKELLASAKAVVLPVEENPYTAATITMLEAMASARAVVVSRTRAIFRGYDFESGRELLFVEPGNVDELADALRRVASDFELCRRLGVRGRDAVVERHGMRVWLDEWRKIFELAVRR